MPFLFFHLAEAFFENPFRMCSMVGFVDTNDLRLFLDSFPSTVIIPSMNDVTLWNTMIILLVTDVSWATDLQGMLKVLIEFFKRKALALTCPSA